MLFQGGHIIFQNKKLRDNYDRGKYSYLNNVYVKRPKKNDKNFEE